MSELKDILETDAKDCYIPVNYDRLKLLAESYPKESLELGLLFGEIDSSTGLEKDTFIPNALIDYFEWEILETINFIAMFRMTPGMLSYFTQIITPLLEHKPIEKLTGEDWEWVDISSVAKLPKGSLYQNMRCHDVFKDGETGKSYWRNGRVFSSDGGKTWATMGADSYVKLDFPCDVSEPKRKIIDEEEK